MDLRRVRGRSQELWPRSPERFSGLWSSRSSTPIQDVRGCRGVFFSPYKSTASYLWLLSSFEGQFQTLSEKYFFPNPREILREKGRQEHLILILRSGIIWLLTKQGQGPSLKTPKRGNTNSFQGLGHRVSLRGSLPPSAVAPLGVLWGGSSSGHT